MRAPSGILQRGLVGLGAALLLTGCAGSGRGEPADGERLSGPSAEVTTSAGSTAEGFDLTGTVWVSEPMPQEQTAGEGCASSRRDFTFHPDGEISYQAKCENELTWRSYDRRPADRWEVQEGVLHLSFNKGYKTCTAPVDPDELRLSCTVRGAPDEDLYTRQR